MRILAYFLALIGSHFGGMLGILLTGALLMRVSWHGFSDSRIYSLYLSDGGVGHLQRALLGFGRALLAFLLGSLVLSVFHVPFTPLFAGLVTLWLIGGDVYGAATGCAFAGRSTDIAYVLALRERARIAIPVNLVVTLLTAWLFLKRS